MTSYADIDFYNDIYKGVVLDATSFDLYARKATMIIKQYTFSRVNESNIPEEVKMCCCELAEHLYSDVTRSQSSNGKTSEKVDDYSVSYANATESESISKAKQMDIIKQWLLMTGLMYRGSN